MCTSVPRGAQRNHRLAALGALLGLVAATQLWLAGSADAADGFGPTSGAGEGCALSEFAYHAACQGQQLADALSYAGQLATSPATSATAGTPPAAKAITTTTTTFVVIPSGPVIQGTPVVLVAQLTPADAAGTVQFMDGNTELGTPRPVFGGFALTVTSKLTPGAHALAALFTPAAQVSFAPSAPPPLSLTVIGLS